MRDDSGDNEQTKLHPWHGIRENLWTPGRRLGAVIPLAAAGALSLFVLFAAFAVWRMPPIDRLDGLAFAQATVLYADDGSEISRYYEQNRTWVSLDSIAAHTIQALLATEDRRFYDHWGVDLWRTVGAAFETVTGDPHGGSTITMQLVRNVFPQIQDDFLLTRKVKEWITSVRIESRYSKDEILEAYLNTVPFVFNTYGIQAAALTYFNKPASALGVPESATLVGMLKGTMFYNPQRNPERALSRRNIVIRQMQLAGFLSPDEARRYADAPLTLSFHHVTPENNHAPYFAEHVRKWLNEWAARRGYNPYTDGLRVHTTLNLSMQAAAEEAVRIEADRLQSVANVSWSRRSVPFFSWDAAAYPAADSTSDRFAYFWEANSNAVDRLIAETDRYRSLARGELSADEALRQLKRDAAFIDSIKNATTRLEASLVAIEPETGHVKAWVGGRDFRVDKYDHVALSRRQPGSTFKPFVYAAALDNGYGPDDVLVDRRVTYRNPGAGRAWSPGNFGGVTGDAYPLRTALALSKNTITAQLTMAVGPRRVAEYARRMGIESELREVPSIGLGTSEVTLLELTAAYATIASNGVYRAPIFVTRVEDSQGNVLETFDTQPREALSPNVAYALLDMMRGVVDYGTGTRIRGQYGVRGDLAGKTGTTQRGADGWFMLMHPDLVAGSWVGFGSPLVYFRTSYWGQGAHNALRVVGEFLNGTRLSNRRFSAPRGYVPPRSTRFRAARLDTIKTLRPKSLVFDTLQYEFSRRNVPARGASATTSDSVVANAGPTAIVP